MLRGRTIWLHITQHAVEVDSQEGNAYFTRSFTAWSQVNVITSEPH